MPYIIPLIILMFLIMCAGRETRFGGLGLLWRVFAWAAVIIAAAIFLFIITQY